MKPIFALACIVVVACGGGTSGVDGGSNDGSPNDGTVQDSSTQDSSSSDAAANDAPYYDGALGPCDGGACSAGLSCCNGLCVDELNDPHNCGGCGSPCGIQVSMCLNGSCHIPTCQPACTASQTCCETIGPVQQFPQCVNGNSCPPGCPTCK